MAKELITTLHPNNNPDVNLYPNIKRENIPNQSIDMTKLDSPIVSLLNSTHELNPSGVDTSEHILSFTSNKGVYIGSDTGHWYYWDGTQYIDGGVYQTAVNYDELEEQIKDLIDENAFTTLDKRSSVFTFFQGYVTGDFGYTSCLISNGAYDTYYFFVDRSCKIYMDNISDNNYLTLGVFDGQLTRNKKIQLFKKTNSDIPDSSNPYTVNGGCYITITVAHNEDFTFYTDSADVFVRLNNKVQFNTAQIEKIREIIGSDTKFYKITSYESIPSILSVYLKSPYSEKYTRYMMYRVTTPVGSNYDCWRIWDIRICDENFNDLYSISESGTGGVECEGAVSESDTPQHFVCGTHGYENMISISLIVDGEIIDLTTLKDLAPFNKIQLNIKSEVYRYGTTTVIFNRSRTLTFDDNGFTIENTFKAVGNISISRMPLSMLNVPFLRYGTTIKNFQYFCSNNNVELYDVDTYEFTTQINKSNLFIDGKMFGNLNIEVSMEKLINGKNQKGFFQYFKQAGTLKIYEDAIVDENMNDATLVYCKSNHKVFANY